MDDPDFICFFCNGSNRFDSERALQVHVEECLTSLTAPRTSSSSLSKPAEAFDKHEANPLTDPLEHGPTQQGEQMTSWAVRSRPQQRYSGNPRVGARVNPLDSGHDGEPLEVKSRHPPDADGKKEAKRLTSEEVDKFELGFYECLQLLDNGLECELTPATPHSRLLGNIRSQLISLLHLHQQELLTMRGDFQKQASEFTLIRLQLEQAQSVLTLQQQEDLSRIRAEEMTQKEAEVEREKKRLQEEHQKQVEMLQSGAVPLIPGEQEALLGNKTVYFPIVPARFHGHSAEAWHFRTAESQFYRFLNDRSSQVIKVEYVVNPLLLIKFKQAREENKTLKPLLVFHGTKSQNVKPICENGFYSPADSGYQCAHGQAMGKGIYFAEIVSTSFQYNVGSKTMLLCQILPFPTEDKSAGIWVIQDKARCLPCYIIHFNQSAVAIDPSSLYGSVK